MTESLTIASTDPRLQAPRWDPMGEAAATRRKLLLLLPVNAVLAVWYFTWLLWPGRMGNPVLYVPLIVAEVFNFLQAGFFWWTSLRAPGTAPPVIAPPPGAEVDVFIPVYNEPLEIVTPTVAAACRQRSVVARVHLLDDKGRPELAALAERHRINYIHRPTNRGAKAGNLNYALARTSAEFVAVLDCDHVPAPNFLEVTAGDLADDSVGFVQTPQYYANASFGPIPAAAWSQQALFFGAICRGKASMGAMFCCGTNVVFRRAALQEAGGFPEGSLTEDFMLSIRLHEQQWRSVYRPTVLASGLGPEDMASYVSQQHRWARGCLGALPAIVRAKHLPLRIRLQYLLASMFFLSGWTFLLYMALPVARILTGAQPVAGATADQFLLHFMPYFVACLAGVAVAGAGSYTFGAFALLFSTFWIHVAASLTAVFRRQGRFVVTPKQGSAQRQPRAVWPTLLAVVILGGAAAAGLARGASPATVNNVAFAGLHICVLIVGARPALSARSSRTAVQLQTSAAVRAVPTHRPAPVRASMPQASTG